MYYASMSSRAGRIDAANKGVRHVVLEDRLLAEALRLYEESGESGESEVAGGARVSGDESDRIAREAGGDFEYRIIVRAGEHRHAEPLKEALSQLRSASFMMLIAGLIVAAIAAAATARATLATHPGEPVNFFWALGGTLGVETLALIIWLLLILLRPTTMSSGSLGGIIFALGRRVAGWLHRGPVQLVAARAVGLVYSRGAIGRWTLSAISHALWLTFLGSCLGLLVLMLSIREYTFAWETTILSEQTYVPMTKAIAVVPQALGFHVPDESEILASRWTGQGPPPSSANEAWSQLLMGSIVVYGMVPRFVLLVICLILRKRACVRYRLDTTLSGYTRLESRIMPRSASIGVVDAEEEPPREDRPAQRISPREADGDRFPGPVAVVGVELDREATSWPIPIEGRACLDLGIVDNREERKRAAELLGQATVSPRLLVAVCSLITTPDRGVFSYLEKLQRLSSLPLAIVLTDGEKLRRRGQINDVGQRVEDWRKLAATIQVSDEAVIEVDLENLTNHSRTILAALTGAGKTKAAKVRQIERAFEVILANVESWKEKPSLSAQAELHHAIAEVYENESESWRRLLCFETGFAGDMTRHIHAGANRVLELMPARLKSSPKWLAIGAVTGALGCVAAATLISPVAIGALPVWSGLGAAIAGIVQAVRKEHGLDEATVTGEDYSEAVCAAALFAVLLEIQGRGEEAITRILDVVANDDIPEMSDPAAVSRWLDSVRHRFDLALAREAKP